MQLYDVLLRLRSEAVDRIPHDIERAGVAASKCGRRMALCHLIPGDEFAVVRSRFSEVRYAQVRFQAADQAHHRGKLVLLQARYLAENPRTITLTVLEAVVERSDVVEQRQTVLW